MKTISYYELLEMIKVGEYPIVEYRNIKYIPDFDNVDGSFIDYQKEQNQNNYNEGEFYLVENLLDCEMFDKLGYDQTKTCFGIWYLDDSNNVFYFNIKGYLELLSHRTIDMEELQAINKQVEELGWNKCK